MVWRIWNLCCSYGDLLPGYSLPPPYPVHPPKERCFSPSMAALGFAFCLPGTQLLTARASSGSWRETDLSMQDHTSASFSPSLITILSIFPAKGHLSRRLRFYINVREGKSSLISMKTIAAIPPGEGSPRLRRRFNFREPLIGKIA